MNPISLFCFRDTLELDDRETKVLWQDAIQVVSPRDLHEVELILDMPKTYLRKLIDNVTLISDSSHFPYRGKKIDLVRCDPHHLKVCQTFVQDSKCISLLNGGLNSIFSKTGGVRGFAKTTAKIIYGRTFSGQTSIAHYLPPIVEERCGGVLALLDGLHRCFITKGVGTNLETIFIRQVEAQFPGELHHWRDVQLVNVKPPKAERFFCLQPELYRNLATAGIDG